MFVYLIGCFLGWQAHAYSVLELQELVNKNAVTSVEELLPLLPDDLRRNFTLQHTSSGLQEASYEFPRIFLFGIAGDFILTFNGHPSQAGFDKLEILEFDTQEKKFHLYEAGFSGVGRMEVTKDPAKCLACHGNARGEIHPIFKDYSLWPGFFGSNHDSPQRNPQELAALKEFNLGRAEHPRYQHLVYEKRQEGKPEAPFFRESRFNYESMPNIRLMDYLHWLNGVRLSARLRESPHYRALLPLLVYFANSLAGFSKEEFSQEDPLVQAVFSEAEFRIFLEELYGAFGKKPADGQNRLKKAELYGLFGLDTSDFSMEIGRGSAFGFRLGLLTRDPDFVNGHLLADFRLAFPSFQARYSFFSLREMVGGLIQTDLEKAFAARIDGYNSLAGIEEYDEKDLLRLIKRGFLF